MLKPLIYMTYAPPDATIITNNPVDGNGTSTPYGNAPSPAPSPIIFAGTGDSIVDKIDSSTMAITTSLNLADSFVYSLTFDGTYIYAGTKKR